MAPKVIYVHTKGFLRSELVVIFIDKSYFNHIKISYITYIYTQIKKKLFHLTTNHFAIRNQNWAETIALFYFYYVFF